jgi:hypothetical protein
MLSRQLMQHPAPGVGAAMQICGLFAFGKGTLLQVVLEWHPAQESAGCDQHIWTAQPETVLPDLLSPAVPHVVIR